MSTRKELKKLYKETPKDMGVYRILNTANGRSMVEASHDMRAKLNRHKAQLKIGGHPNKALQQDWNHYGEEKFEFEYLDVLAPLTTPDYDPAEDLEVLEEMWLDKLKPFGDKGYK